MEQYHNLTKISTILIAQENLQLEETNIIGHENQGLAETV